MFWAILSGSLSSAEGAMARCQTCGLSLSETATFCATCGAPVRAESRLQLGAQPTPRSSPPARRWVFAGVLAAGLIVVVGIGLFTALASHRQPAPIPTGVTPTYSLSQFDRLRTGMTDSQVVSILKTGDATAQNSLAITSPQFYDYYENADGQSMRLFFQNGLLSQKVECGLR